MDSMELDHLVYAAADLETAVDALEQRLGVRAGPGGRHEALGTHNALLGLGPATYLEILAPDPEAENPATPGVLGLASATSSELLATWAVRCDDIDDAVARARERGFDPWDPVDAHRTGADGRTTHWRLTINALAGGPLPFLIDWGDAPHPASSAPSGLGLESFHLEDPEPDGLLAGLSALGVQVDVRRADAPALVALISGPHGPVELR